MWHYAWLWVYYNAQTIQAAAAIGGLIGLIYYSAVTKRIWVTTLAQSDASRRPYFHAEDWQPETDSSYRAKNYYQFKNVGSGIALNVRWRFSNAPDDAALMPLGSCAVGRVKYLFTLQGHWTEYEELEANGGIYLEYEDTAGRSYWNRIIIRTMADGSSHALVDTGDCVKKSLLSRLKKAIS